MSGVAVWDGTKWCGASGTFNNIINAVEVYNNQPYIAGFFSQIDGFPYARIARYTGPVNLDTCGLVGISEIQNQNNFFLYPNPTTGIFTISTSSINPLPSSITIYNTLGELISPLSLRRKPVLNGVEGGGEVTIDLSSQPKGIYFIKIISEDKIYTQKLIIQ